MSESYGSLPSFYGEWLKVWQSPWLMMHESWESCIPDMCRDQNNWAQLSPAHLRTFLEIEDDIPPKPGEALQQWLQMNTEGRLYALKLAADIVAPGAGDAELVQDEIIWGRHIAKALTPGKWPISEWKSRPAELIGLLLLRQWMAPITWQRVRLLYDKRLLDAVLEEPFVEIPENRLNQLWHAVMWRLSQIQAPPTVEHSPVTDSEDIS